MCRILEFYGGIRYKSTTRSTASSNCLINYRHERPWWEKIDDGYRLGDKFTGPESIRLSKLTNNWLRSIRIGSTAEITSKILQNSTHQPTTNNNNINKNKTIKTMSPTSIKDLAIVKTGGGTHPTDTTLVLHSGGAPAPTSVIESARK